MRIAIDIDSTLHHYWDTLSESSVRRFGIELPYEEQLTWGITRLRPEQLEICIAETHSDENIMAGRPYPEAVEVVSRWHRSGHQVLIASHRSPRCAPATKAWLEAIGLPHDGLYCDFDKVGHCRETQVDVLIDDSPHNLADAAQEGIVVATITHPWNRDLCDSEPVISAADWPELERLLVPVLGGGSDAALDSAA
jgi:uncharacterized HAD superfamily protein